VWALSGCRRISISSLLRRDFVEVGGDESNALKESIRGEKPRAGFR
jgi:hypothetical protein